jgi:hypothetical protein
MTHDSDQWYPKAVNWNGTVYMTIENRATGAWIIPRQVVLEAGEGMLAMLAERGGMVEDERGH